MKGNCFVVIPFHDTARIAVTPKQILQMVHDGADARIGDTVERLMVILHNRHTHQCWKRECGCEYCQFINGEYVNAKLQLHQIKKQINHYERIWYLTDGEVNATVGLVKKQLEQKQHVRMLKTHKKNLQTNII